MDSLSVYCRVGPSKSPNRSVPASPSNVSVQLAHMPPEHVYSSSSRKNHLFRCFGWDVPSLGWLKTNFFMVSKNFISDFPTSDFPKFAAFGGRPKASKAAPDLHCIAGLSLCPLRRVVSTP